MAWEMTAVKDTTPVKVAVNDIDEDAKTCIDEAFPFCEANPDQRLVIPFESVQEAKDAIPHLRSYCEARTPRLTLSVWVGHTGTKGEGTDAKTVWSSGDKPSKTAKTPALSLRVKLYEAKDATE